MTLDPFKKLYKKEGAKGSVLMWYIALIHDPESPLRNLPEADRIQTLVDNKLVSPDYVSINKALLDEIRVAYLELTETPALRQLRIWNAKMDEKSILMEKTVYDMDTFEILEKMMISNAKIYAELEAIMKKVLAESEITVKGGGQESLTDKGII